MNIIKQCVRCEEKVETSIKANLFKYCPNCRKIVDRELRCKYRKEPHTILMQKLWRDRNKDSVYQRIKKYKNSEIGKQKKRLWNKKYGEKHKEIRAIMQKQKRKQDPQYRIKTNMRVRINKALVNNSKYSTKKSLRTRELLGCSFSELKQYLESKFTKEMTWENYGVFWCIDHIKPCAIYDFRDIEQQRLCFHYTNLQPLKVIDNLKKGGRIL